MTAYTTFGWGVLTSLGMVAALCFARYWKVTRDRFFLLFSAAFLLLAVNWMVLAIVHPQSEARHYVYVIRLCAFVLILGAIGDKNRRPS
jgi:hypothetical protein